MMPQRNNMSESWGPIWQDGRSSAQTRLFHEDSPSDVVMVGFTPGKWDCLVGAPGDSCPPATLDEDSGLGMETDMAYDFYAEPDAVDLDNTISEFQESKPKNGLRRCRSFNVRRSLFTSKRPAAHQDVSTECMPETKRRRACDMSIEEKFRQFCIENTSENENTSSTVIRAVDRLTSDDNLVADGSRVNMLPTIPGKHRDLNAISANTLKDMLDGDYDVGSDKMTIIDCRYPYEFEGGHIKGALNLYTKELVDDFLHQHSLTDGRHVLIFHCEFSSERGPKMYRFLRSQDRQLNKDNYPALNFPEIYLLEGGYKAFYHQHKEDCFPMEYKQMLHKEHADDLRHFRVKSKSWAAGDKQRKPQRMRLSF